jgi:uncharacterized protein YxjI
LPVEVSGFDYYYEHSFYADGNVNFTVDGHSYDLSVGSDDLTLKRAGGEELINIELKKILNDLNDNYGVVTQIPGSDFTFEFGDEYFRGKLVFENLSASYMGEEFESFIVGDVRTFLRKK